MKYRPYRIGASIALALFALCMAAGFAPNCAFAAQIDPSTPKSQSGYTLLAIVRGDAQGQYHFPVPGNLSFLSGPASSGYPGGIGLWIKGPAPAAPAKRAKGARSVPSQFVQMPDVAAIGLHGESVTAQCARSYAQGDYSPGNRKPPLYLVSIPGGYPDGYGSIDVIISDLSGHRAQWRLTHLPQSYHAISGPVKPHATFAADGVRLSVNAWHDNGPSFGNSDHADFRGIDYQIQSKMPAGTKWEVRITKQELEWEPLNPAKSAASLQRYPIGYVRPPLATLPLNPTGVHSSLFRPQGAIRNPYAAHDHYIRLEGSLVQVATTDEPLTFHNLSVKALPNPYANQAHVVGPGGKLRAYVPPPSYEIVGAKQTAVTPSGVSVTLMPLSALRNVPSGFGGFGDSARMLLKFDKGGPRSGPVALPKSSLYRKYRKPVTITLQATAPYMLENIYPAEMVVFPGMSASGQLWFANLRFNNQRPAGKRLPNGRFVLAQSKPTIPKHLDHLTLTVHEQADIKSIPVSFLVPVAAQAPASARRPILNPRSFARPMPPNGRKAH